MAAPTITRTAWTDDDGTGTSGTVVNNAEKTTLYTQIDAVVAALYALAMLRAPRVTSLTSSATPTPNADTDDLFDVTALAVAAAFVNPTGTPLNGQRLMVRIKDNGTARALTWGTAYVAGGVALPSTTVISKILTIGFMYNTANALNKWQCITTAQEA